MNKPKMRVIYVGAVVLGLLLLYWGVFRGSSVSVETAAAKRKPMVVTVDGEGKTRVRDKRTVTAPVSGKMSQIRLAEGDNIPHDYPITAIDPNPPVQRAPDVFDDRPSIYAAKVYAPISGKVLRIFDKSERMVTAGTPLLELGDPDNIEFVVDILSTEAVRIRPGMAVIIDDPARGEPLKARVKLVESQAITKVSALGVEEQRVNVVGDFLSTNLNLGDNFRIDLKIVVWSTENVLAIPASALFREGDAWSVFVVDGGKARRRSIEVGQQNDEEAEVKNGVAEGETVVLHPPNQLADGASVNSR